MSDLTRDSDAEELRHAYRLGRDGTPAWRKRAMDDGSVQAIHTAPLARYSPCAFGAQRQWLPLTKRCGPLGLNVNHSLGCTDQRQIRHEPE